MGSGFLPHLKNFLHPHYVFNYILCASYFFLKVTVPFCSNLFDDCVLEMREWELLTFLGCIIVLKNRKQPSYKDYIGIVCMFMKILNGILYLRQNPIYAAVYFIICLIHFVFLPVPSYSGPEYITYFRGPNIQEELSRDKRVTWLIEFYAAWSPQCVTFAPVFAELSAKYSLDNLKFGKIDASRYTDVAQQYKVDTSSFTKQLPTVILFQNGKEVRRRPAITSAGKLLAKFVFSDENVVKDFELNELYLQNKKTPLKKEKKGSSKTVEVNGKEKSE